MADRPSLQYETAERLLREKHHVEIETYCETGARHGVTLEQFFERGWDCHAVELHEGAFKQLRNKIKPCDNLHLGDTAKLMPKVLDNIKTSALFFLDAHWWGGYGAEGAYSNNPLFSELCAIRNHEYDDFVIIDDAQAFEALQSRCRRSKIDAGWQGINTQAVLTALSRRRVRDYGRVKGGIHDQMWISLRS